MSTFTARRVIAAARRVLPVFLPAALCALLLVTGSCGDSSRVAYSRFVSLNPAGWENSEYCVYRMADASDRTFADTTARYDIIVTVRHNTRYPFNNLWLVLESATPADSVKSSKVNLRLAGGSGTWRGHSMQGIYEFSDTVARNVSLTRDNVLSLRHDMPEPEIAGLLDMGLTIVRH